MNKLVAALAALFVMLGLNFLSAPGAEAVTRAEHHCKTHSWLLNSHHVTVCAKVYYGPQADGTGFKVHHFELYTSNCEALDSPPYGGTYLTVAAKGLEYGKIWNGISLCDSRRKVSINVPKNASRGTVEVNTRVRISGWSDWKPYWRFDICKNGGC